MPFSFLLSLNQTVGLMEIIVLRDGVMVSHLGQMFQGNALGVDSTSRRGK